MLIGALYTLLATVVVFRSPHISALRDGNRKAIPDQYLPKDYNARWFRVMKDRSAAAAGK